MGHTRNPGNKNIYRHQQAQKEKATATDKKADVKKKTILEQVSYSESDCVSAQNG